MSSLFHPSGLFTIFYFISNLYKTETNNGFSKKKEFKMYKDIYKLIMWVLMSVFLVTGLTSAQVSVSPESNEIIKSTTAKFPIFTLSPMAGGIFPVSEFGNTYQAGFSGALDGAIRLNKELGIYSNIGYYSLSSSVPNAPHSEYFEISAGPRYYFTKSNLKSTFFIESGLGAYFFSQDAYGEGAEYVDRQSSANLGFNIGPGFTMQASKSVDLILKTKYQMVFLDGGTRSFITGLGGIEFKF